MSNKNAEDGGGFGKPLGVILVFASLTVQGGEPVEQESDALTDLKIQRPTEFVAYLPHGAEPLTGYTHTLEGIVRMATTTSTS